MFAGNVSIHLKSNALSDYTRTFENDTLPLLREQKGFKDESILLLQMATQRKLIWIEKGRFHGWGCSECAWVFKASDPPIGKSFSEMLRNFEEQRDNEFASHVCAEHTRTKSTKC